MLKYRIYQNGSTNFNEIFSVYLVGMRIGPKVFFTLLPPTLGVSQTSILRFTVDFFCLFKVAIGYRRNN